MKPENTEMPSPPAPGSAIRPHAEQTTLERVLRSHLWKPQYQLARAKENLPKHVKRKEYRESAECQSRIGKAESEIKEWEYLLELYELEKVLDESGKKRDVLHDA